MRWLRWLAWVLVAGAVVLAVIYGFLPTPAEVEAARVDVGSVVVTITEEGKTRVVDRFEVSAPVAGLAHRIDLDVGDPVKAGDVLVVLEPLRSSILDPRSRATAEARIAEASARLEAVREDSGACPICGMTLEPQPHPAREGYGR